MFKLVDIPEIDTTVEFNVPGQKEPATVTARWRLLSRDEQEKFQKRVRDGEVTDEQMLQEMLVNVSGISDGNGNEMADSAQLRAALLQTTYVAQPLIMSFWTAQQGRERHVAKN